MVVVGGCVALYLYFCICILVNSVGCSGAVASDISHVMSMSMYMYMYMYIDSISTRISPQKPSLRRTVSSDNVKLRDSLDFPRLWDENGNDYRY